MHAEFWDVKCRTGAGWEMCERGIEQKQCGRWGRWAPKDEVGQEHSWKQEQYVQSLKLRWKLKSEEAAPERDSSVCYWWGWARGEKVGLCRTLKALLRIWVFLLRALRSHWRVLCRKMLGSDRLLKDHSGCWGEHSGLAGDSSGI